MVKSNSKHLLKSKVFLLGILLLSACRQGDNGERKVVPLVGTIVSDRSEPYNSLLSSFDLKSSDGGLVLFGAESEVSALGEYLLHSDLFDNVDARRKPDLLPDFSGEKIVEVTLGNASLLSDTLGGGLKLRTASIKAMLSAVDTLVGGKAVVLTSPAMCSYGKFDIDSLQRAFSLGNLVFCPLELMADATEGGRVAVLGAYPEGVYEEYFKYRDDVDYVGALTPSQMADSLHTELDRLSADVILVDACGQDTDSLRLSHPYLRFVDWKEQTGKALYLALRERNAFTHKVAYPQKESVWAICSEDLTYSFNNR